MAGGTRRKVRDRDEARTLLDELADSGMDLRAFCRLKGLDGRSLQCWRTNLRRPTHAPVRLVELVPRAPHPTTTAPRYRVHLNNRMIEVDDAFRSDTLARLIDLVAAC